MEGFERPVLESATHPPHWWKHYVDDTHTVLLKPHVHEFIDHLNSINDNIKWTTEGDFINHTLGDEEENIVTRTERVLVFLYLVGG